ncbi:cytochrome P450 [Zopfia rhizophila CBS 207.26]|uniref:Cytochrome P450 n=1 Tax=Zopfia rhizophila CBS 207.26 TaxID=1314779 RepID=A0A6A6DQA2_9PEZI|nr:cytochrome P450 [Zopfia rhizophila CBS 207.26]
MWATQLVVALATAAIVAAVISKIFGTKPDPREPPVLHPKVPFIGHIIGLLSNGTKYYATVSARCKYPIFSLPMLSSRTYIVTSPTLASHIQRASTTLLFAPLIIGFTDRMVGFQDKTSVAKIRDLKAKEENRPDFMDRMHDMMYFVLSPSEINIVSAIMLEQLSNRINAVPNETERELFEWVREQFTAVTSYAFHGPENLFAMEPRLIEDFFIFERGLVGLMSSPVPQLTARKAYLARERVFKGLLEYMAKGRYKKGSTLVQNRYRMHSEIGLSLPDIARSEIGMLFGLLPNASITTFWVLNNIFSRPQLLAEIREEIQKNALSIDGSGKIRTISFESLRSSCPLLNSVYRESLRLNAPMTSTRLVVEDTIVADTYLLRANSVVQIAGDVIHKDTNVWGPDASSFNPRRFISSPYGTKTGVAESEKSPVHPAAFRGFGGGSVFCPGRHFAQREILSLVAAVVTIFDLEPPKGEDHIPFNPPIDETRLPLGVMKPLREVSVRMKRRDVEDVKWVLALT